MDQILFGNIKKYFEPDLINAPVTR